MLSIVSFAVCLAGPLLAPVQATDAATSADARLQSWQQHETLRRTSPYRHLRWHAIGPRMQGGRIEAIAVPPGDPSTMYVGVGSGGLWKTTNSGTTWTPVFAQQSSVAIGDVAISPAKPERVWLGTGEVLLARSALPGSGIFLSDDAGRTWKHVGLFDSQHIARILPHPSNPNVAFVAAIGHQNSANEERGVFRTGDGGKSWQRLLFVNDHTAAIDLVMEPGNPDVLYASMWERTLPGQQHTGEESGLYKTSDGGKSWQRLAGGLPRGPHVGRIAVHVAPSDPSIVYALADEGRVDGFYRSADHGKTFTRLYDGLQARWDWCELRVSPDNPNEVYSIGQNSFVTKDGGRTFQKIAGTIVHLLPHGSGVLHLDTHAMWINPEDPDHVVFGTDGGVFVTQDRCRTWLHLNNMPIAECYAVTRDDRDPYNVYVGTQDNAALFGPATHRLADGRAEAWRHVYLDPWGGGDSYFTYRDPTDPDTIYYEHQFGELRRKNMRTGRTRRIKPRGEELRFAWMTPFFPSTHAGGTLYYGANRVFKSTDRGENWQAISDVLVAGDPLPNARYQAITTLAESALAAGLLVAGTDNGNVWITEDDGAHWTAIDDGLPDRNVTRVLASPHGRKTLFVTFSGTAIDDYRPYVYRSDDLGVSWQPIHDGLPLEPVNVILEDPRVPGLLYVGTDLGVYCSPDGGSTWQSLMNNLPTAAVHDLLVHPQKSELVVATHGLSCFLMNVADVQHAARGVTYVGSRRELFTDQSLIAKLKGSAELRLQRPRPEGVVLTTDRPWEGNTSAYFTVFRDGAKFRMYYRGSHWDEQRKRPTHREVTCYAESKDGIQWQRPNLGLFEFEGSRENNIVWDGVGSHCFTPFRDTNPDCPPEARYKAISRGRPQRAAGLYAFQSPDGIHWQLIQEEPVITVGAFDSQNLAFWDQHAKCYRAYHRNFRKGVRDIMTQTSRDFVHWSDPEYIRIDGAPREHLYTNAVRSYFRAPHLLIGFPTRYLPKEGERVEPTFMSSRDGYHFHRYPQPVIPEDAPEDRRGNRSNYMVNGLLALDRPGGSATRELSVFGTEAYYTGPDSRVRRFVYRADGFVALHANADGGEMISRPLIFKGQQLQMNYRTADEGSVKVSLVALDEPSVVGPVEVKGDEIDGVVNLDAAAVKSLEGKAVRLRIELQNADVFAFRFVSN